MTIYIETLNIPGKQHVHFVKTFVLVALVLADKQASIVAAETERIT
jgi:hypothetical protein